MTVEETSVRPVLLAPRGGMLLSDVAVHFLWTTCECVLGYQIHYDRDAGFSGGVCRVILVSDRESGVQDADHRAYLPEQVLEQGEWFWRVRPMVPGGKFGPWSETGSFKVRQTGVPRPREIEVSAKHPLFLLHSDREIVPNWGAIEASVRRNTALRLECRPDGLTDVCRVAQEHSIPLIVQVATCHEVVFGEHQRMSLSDVECIFQEFPTVKGAMLVEQACQSGVSSTTVTTYVKRLLALAASYGKVVIWADGHWNGANTWVDVQEDEGLYRALERYSDYFIPAWKQNCGWSPLLIQSCVSGLWHGGAAFQWGVEPEFHYWYEAGFTKINEQRGFKEGDGNDCPMEFYANMAVLGLSAGAAFYCFEPNVHIWSKPGEVTRTWKEIVLPLLSGILDRQLIAEKSEVEEEIKVAYETGPADSLWLPESTGWPPLYDETYGRTHPYQMIPQSGRYYWIPAVSRHRNKDLAARFEKTVTRESLESLPGPGGTAALFNRYYEEMGSGSAWRVKVGDVVIVMHSHENRDDVQDFSVDFCGRLSRISGRLEVNSFLIIKKMSDDALWLFVCGRREREVALSIEAKGEGPVDVRLSLPEACTSREWGASDSSLKVRISHRYGAVSCDLRAP